MTGFYPVPIEESRSKEKSLDLLLWAKVYHYALHGRRRLLIRLPSSQPERVETTPSGSSLGFSCLALKPDHQLRLVIAWGSKMSLKFSVSFAMWGRKNSLQTSQIWGERGVLLTHCRLPLKPIQRSYSYALDAVSVVCVIYSVGSAIL